MKALLFLSYIAVAVVFALSYNAQLSTKKASMARSVAQTQSK